MSNQVQALVVGAGISGLTTAYALQKADISTVIVEAASRPGGLIQSVQREGFLLECGPQSFSGNFSLTAVCRDLNLLDERVLADPKAPRYVLIDGKLQNVPMGPGLLGSPLMGGGTRGAILRDIFGSSRAPETDESVAQFTRRKFSATLLERLVGPFVSGVYAGDPEKLSLRAAFPILHEAEVASGSVVRGMFPAMKQRRVKRGNTPREKPTLQTFRQGNETLIRALAAHLGERLICGVEVTSLEPLNNGRRLPNAPRFRVTLRTSRGEEKLETERLILAVPTNVAGKLLAPLHPAFQSELGPVEYAGVAVVSLGYRKVDVGHLLSGFGFLVPRSSGLSVLGTVWNSSLFPGRAPEGYALLTSFVGGATNPAAIRKPPEELVSQVHGEIAPLLAIRNQALFSNVTIWPRALPQYNLGHTSRLAALEKLRSQFPGLHFAGNYLNGPAIGACVEYALKVADEIRVSFAN
ncbi:MAG TPA: protoporphyrinogen oxidase [Candidatus Sulfotelmatobacter sp.]|nr:protoporphyrinogen oxidase [Candidatus Sulfotelmatobacter sp.]